MHIPERSRLAVQDSARAAGARPAPYVLRVAGAESPPVGVWEAALNAGAGQVLDAELLAGLSNFFNEASGETAKYQRYTQFTERVVWPILAAGDTAAFYDVRTGRLRPEFIAHRWQLEEIVRDLESQVRLARQLAAQIAQRYPVVTAGGGSETGSR